jgi:arylsulfatase A
VDRDAERTKQDLYEGGHRVPFIIRWPGVLKPGRVSETLISQVDLMATLASLVGFVLPPNAAEDSFDLLPYLRSETPVGPRRELVYNTHRDHYGFREGDWVLIDTKTGDARPVPAAWKEKHQQPADDDLPVELYNLKNDPGQRHNLAAAHPERVAAMQARLKQLRDQGHSAPRLAREPGGARPREVVSTARGTGPRRRPLFVRTKTKSGDEKPRHLFETPGFL